ncbi:MAG: crossover junction endodeoxyribonuclease RuvC [Candidatus Pacebacteria bacterium]|nr:crossover junction endodeoxyribonuclease RuvC [Candidatus Paceibacterota bacterium]
MLKPVSIAVDPGYDRVGIAVFEGTTLLHSECFTTLKGDLPDRLLAVHERVRLLIQEFHPISLAIETLFFNKNQKTAIAVAEARGAIVVAARAEGVSVHEYSPQAVKIAVTGSGNATKDGVIRMVSRLVALDTRARLDDEYDAIALGIAHTAHNAHLRPLR